MGTHPIFESDFDCLTEMRVLCVGLTCLDIVTEVDSYPTEDTDQRSKGLSWRRGGNATNNCTVLKQLGVDCEFYGTLSSLRDDVGQTFVTQDMDRVGIRYSNCVLHPHPIPSSVILLNVGNGSRTIVHHRGEMPEITLEDFKTLDLSQYSWIHFEGGFHSRLAHRTYIQGRTKSGERPHVSQIIEHVIAQRDHLGLNLKVSVELEKTYIGVEKLGYMADVIFVSKEFSHKMGQATPEAMVKEFRSHIRGDAILICPWGSKGAVASTKTEVFSSPSFPPEKLIDTLGAGDSFVGSTISQLNKGIALQDAITFGCRFAGAKCGQMGLENIKF